MMDSVHLDGSDDVARAGRAMQQAAIEMREAASAIDNAANVIDGVMQDHRAFMEEWITRFEQALGSHARDTSGPTTVRLSADDLYTLSKGR